MSEYYKKYLKYKNKYINLQKQIGSGKKTAISIFTGLDKNAPNHPALQTSSNSVDSLVLRAQLAYNAQKSNPGDDITLPQVPPVPYVPEQIEPSDIMYKDDLVCILRPDVKKGIIVFTNFKQPTGTDSLCNLGLKTGEQLQKDGIDFGRSKIHPYIFFRAPYYSRNIDYTSVETEINSSYGKGQIGIKSRAFIRVDPDNTFVFSSEIRNIFKHSVWYGKENTMINNSKKTLSEYLEIINNNREMRENVKPDKKIWYNLFTSKAVLFPIAAHPEEPFDDEQIQRNSEILVLIPHLTPNYFVLCTS